MNRATIKMGEGPTGHSPDVILSHTPYSGPHFAGRWSSLDRRLPKVRAKPRRSEGRLRVREGYTWQQLIDEL
jgi:hypothetical protein